MRIQPRPRYGVVPFDLRTGLPRPGRDVRSYAEALGVCRGGGGLIRDRLAKVGGVMVRVVGPRGGTLVAVRRGQGDEIR